RADRRRRDEHLPPAPNAREAGMRRRVALDLTSRALLALAVYTFFSATDEHYRGVHNLYPLLNGFALTGLVALGLGVTMIAGELDLSVGSMAAVAGIIAIYLSGWGVVPCLAVAVAVGAAFGALQGAVIAKLRINSLVFTIGTLIALRGVAFVISHEHSVLVNLNDLSISDSVIRKLWIFSPLSLTAIAAFVVVGLLMAFAKRGREIYAIGGGRNEAGGRAGEAARRGTAPWGLDYAQRMNSTGADGTAAAPAGGDGGGTPGPATRGGSNVRLKDVARVAGVHPATVSRALDPGK